MIEIFTFFAQRTSQTESTAEFKNWDVNKKYETNTKVVDSNLAFIIFFKRKQLKV